VALVAWFSLVLAGREHVLQAVGLELACIHPGDGHPGDGYPGDGYPGDRASTPVSSRAEPGHPGHGQHHAKEASASPPDGDAPGTSAQDADEGDDCPAGCTECACGAAPCAPSPSFVVVQQTWHTDRFGRDPSRAGPSRIATALERPPRRA